MFCTIASEFDETVKKISLLTAMSTPQTKRPSCQMALRERRHRQKLEDLSREWGNFIRLYAPTVWHEINWEQTPTSQITTRTVVTCMLPPICVRFTSVPPCCLIDVCFPICRSLNYNVRKQKLRKALAQPSLR